MAKWLRKLADWLEYDAAIAAKKRQQLRWRAQIS